MSRTYPSTSERRRSSALRRRVRQGAERLRAILCDALARTRGAW